MLPREKLDRSGINALSGEELVALILRTGASGESVSAVAQKVYSIIAFRDAPFAELAALTGVGPVKAAGILGALALSERIASARKGKQLLNPAAVAEACMDLLSRPQEHVVLFTLAARSAVIERFEIAVGTATAALLHPRDIFRIAVQQNAVAVALVHNHPSGRADPSPADEQITARVAATGELLGIELIDHVIVARGGYTSLRQYKPELFQSARVPVWN